MMKLANDVRTARAHGPGVDLTVQDVSDMDVSELEVAAYGRGAIQPPMQHSSGPIVVYMDEEKTQMPFGFVDTSPFLELFWRKTGADCEGEEEEMEFPGGGKYSILLKETRPRLRPN